MEAPGDLNLYHLFPKERLFEDSNGDGYPDKLRLRLEIASGLKDCTVWAGLLNLSARIVQQVMSIDSPLIKKADSARRNPGPTLSVALPRKAASFPAGIRRFTRNHLYIEGSCEQAMGRLLNSLALSNEKEIAPLPNEWEMIQISSDGKAVDVHNQKNGKLTTLPIYDPPEKPSDRNPLGPESIEDLIDFPNTIYGLNDLKDPRSKLLKLNIELASKTLSSEAGISLADFLALYVLESTDIMLPIAFARDLKEISGTLQIFQKERGIDQPEQAGIRLCEGRIVVSGDERGLSKMFRHWAVIMAASLKQEPEKEDAFFRILTKIQNLISGRAPRGRWGRKIIRAVESRAPLPPSEAGSRKWIESACRLLEIPFPPLKAKEPLRRRISWPDEIGRIDKCIEEIPEGIGLLEGQVFVSRSLTTRLECRKRWESMLTCKGYIPRLQVLNTYKPGFSWLTEAVLPALTPIQKQVDTACMSFQSYTPSPSDNLKGLEMKSRWLQEAFPGPDCIAQNFGWPPERIRFQCDPQLTEAYRFQALDKTGRILFEDGFTPFESCMAFIGHQKENGCVHPTASGIRLRQNGTLLYQRMIASDRERFWRILQNRWLPEMEAEMAARLHQVVKNDQPLFWEQVRLEVAIDESDERLPIGQERICPMEALHEDIYFGLLDFFSGFCAAHGITDQEAHFGRILPVVSAVAKKGKPAASLIARPSSLSDSETIRPMPSPRVVAISFSKNRCLVSLTDTADDLTLNEKRMIGRIAEAWNIDLTFDGLLFQANLSIPEKSRRDLPAHIEMNHPPPMNRTIGLAETGAWVARFEKFPHLKVACGGTSVQGRAIPVVEAFLQGSGIHTSIAKTRALKPTLLLIARHHANEVSSTNAALSLCWKLSQTRSGRETLRHVNLACIPLENPDGVATYEALLPECEDHILHAARYNALGAEWYGDYLSDSPRFPEAAVKTRLWHRWLPAYVLDAHGVPNHEWVQPFGGYLNYRFREYWIPRAFLFVILPFIDDPEHPEHEHAKTLAKSFGDRLSNENDIQELNRSLKGRYERYARRFAPEVFPKSATEHLEIMPPGPRISRTNFGYRARPVTRNEIISEVVDEGATGEWLEKCVRAHLIIADTLLSFLADHPKSRLETVRRSNGFLSVGWQRSNGP